MVDFEIKLQDNKVADWSANYMDYAGLKKTLKKAKSAQTKYQDLRKRTDADLDNSGVSRRRSYRKEEDNDGISVETSLDDYVSVATEETTLLPRSRRLDDDMVGRKFSVKSALGNISGLFLGDVEGRETQRLEDARKAWNEQIDAFGVFFHQEQKKVRAFYYDTLDDLEERLEFMKSSVAKAFDIDVDEASPAVGDYRRVSPFVTNHKRHRKTLSMDDVMGDFLNSITGTDEYNCNSKHQRILTSRGHLHRNDYSSRTERRLPKSHKRGVTNIQLGHLLQEDGEDDELHFQSADSHNDTNSTSELDEKRAADAEMIKRFLVSQYRTTKYLHNYAMLNITGFVKIAKKFDKTIPTHAGTFASSLQGQNMMDDAQDVEALTRKYEVYYANWFCEGDVRASKVQMLSKQGDDLEMDWSQLQLGYRMGVCAVLALWVCWDCIWGVVKKGESTIGERSAFPIFRACGGLLLLQWFWGCSVFVWTRYRINYIYLFDFIPSTVSTPFDIFYAAVDNTLLFMVLMLLYYKAGANDIPELIPTEMYPLILILITMFKLIFPLRPRRLMWQTIYRVITSPACSPTFFHTYVGDIFTSMVKIFQDIAWSIAWLYAGKYMSSTEFDGESKHEWSKTHWYKGVVIPIITMMPLVIRFNQCLRKFWDSGDRFPHLANASKYALSSLVTLFGIFHPLYLEYNSGSRERNSYQIFWTLIFITSSIYSFAWDVYMDWGLGRPKYLFLNKSLIFPRKIHYYATIGIDLILRFLWVLTLVPPNSGASFALPEYLTALSMMLELFRRTLWGFFRLENEHRSYEYNYRRKGFVPLHFNTGHIHMYKNKKERAGGEVVRELILVTFIVGAFCFATIAAAQHANQRSGEL